MERRRKIIVLFSAICLLMSAALAPVFSGPPYYHEEGNVNYPGSYFEAVYIKKGIGVDDYITMVDRVLIGRTYGNMRDIDPTGIFDYNPDADINEDGIIDARDMSLAAYFYGLNYRHSPFPDGTPPPLVRVDAPGAPIHVHEQFNVSIKIVNVQRLNMYECTLSWNPMRLAAISVRGGGFISGEGEELIHTIINDDEGYLYTGDFYMGTPAYQNGSGTLAQVTFECLGEGKVALDLSSRLFDPDLNAMPHKDLDDTIKQHP